MDQCRREGSETVMVADSTAELKRGSLQRDHDFSSLSDGGDGQRRAAPLHR
jgi:hypothetical protein